MTGQQAKIIVGPGSLFELAESWSLAGLLGDFAWLDSEFLSGGIPNSEWQTITARVLELGRGSSEQRLMEYLSRLEGITSVLVLWIRAPEEEVAEGFGSVEWLMTRAFPHVTSRVRIDLINPTEMGELGVPTSRQGWEQFVIATQDHPEVDQADSGWLPVKDAVAIHTVGALAGILSGATMIVHSSPDRPPRFVHAFSRHVGGGQRAHVAATSYFDDQLPNFDATDISPQSFAHPLKSEEMVDGCISWVQTAHGGVLSYETPVSDSAHEKLLTRLNLRLAGWVVAFRQLVSSQPVDVVKQKQNQLESLIADHEEQLEQISSQEGSRPASTVWNSLLRLITSMVDGGSPPVGFSRSEWVDQQLVLSPSMVDPEPEYRLHQYPEDFCEQFPQFQSNPPLAIADSAIAEVGSLLQNAPEPLISVSKGVSFSKAVRTTNDSDASLRDQQKKELAEDWQLLMEEAERQSLTPPVRLVDRLYLGFLRDSLYSRLNGKRWQELATAPWTVRTGGARARAAFLVSLGFVVSSLGLSLWPRFRDQINEASLGLFGSSVPEALGWAFGPLVGLGLAAWGIGVLAAALRKQLLDIENQMRIRQLLFDRSYYAYENAGRLDHVVRIFGLWWTIFQQLHRGPGDPSVGEQSGLPIIPASLQFAEPAIHVNFEPLMIAKSGTEIGWRSRSIESLATTSLSNYKDVDYHDSIEALCSDLGTSEGALHRLARDLITGAIWEEWRGKEINRLSTRILDGLVSPENKVMPDSNQTVRDFLGEVQRDAQIIPGIHQIPETAREISVETIMFSTDGSFYGDVSGPSLISRGPVNGAAAVLIVLAEVPPRSPDKLGSSSSDSDQFFSDGDFVL